MGPGGRLRGRRGTMAGWAPAPGKTRWSSPVHSQFRDWGAQEPQGEALRLATASLYNRAHRPKRPEAEAHARDDFEQRR